VSVQEAAAPALPTAKFTGQTERRGRVLEEVRLLDSEQLVNAALRRQRPVPGWQILGAGIDHRNFECAIA
jgi:hypothetical protein